MIEPELTLGAIPDRMAVQCSRGAQVKRRVAYEQDATRRQLVLV